MVVWSCAFVGLHATEFLSILGLDSGLYSVSAVYRGLPPTTEVVAGRGRLALTCAIKVGLC